MPVAISTSHIDTNHVVRRTLDEFIACILCRPRDVPPFGWNALSVRNWSRRGPRAFSSIYPNLQVVVVLSVPDRGFADDTEARFPNSSATFVIEGTDRLR
jgi:hypothetical protein